MSGINKQAILAIMIGLLASSCGCSIIIAKSGIYSEGEILSLKTRDEVLKQFGVADETRTCPGGFLVEHRWIRRQISIFTNFYDDPDFYLRSFGLWEIIALPITAYRSEKAQFHYAFVYDENGRLLYRYDLKLTPRQQLNDALRPLAEEFMQQLREGKYGTWSKCIANYVKEARQRAGCIEYALGPEEVWEFEFLLTIGEWADLGLINCEDALSDINEAFPVRFGPFY